MKEILIILFSAVLTDNFVLSRIMGICPFLGVSKNRDSAVGMGIAVTVVMALATAVTYPIDQYLLAPFNLSYLQTIVFILVIASFVQLLELVLKRFIPSLYQALGIYLPLITTNCAVLGVTLLNVDPGNGYTFLEAIVNAVGAGLGFLMALFLFSGVRTRLNSDTIPKCFRGLPVTLTAAAIMAIAFTGLKGVVEGLFA
ncbi:MAG: RnfABCDGE type electron transport complex subunit A [Ruminococcaceae bacterium]|nr:RnfABCDGE type electron transport complex subunit A [Oscillospiraceae bacterium]